MLKVGKLLVILFGQTAHWIHQHLEVQLRTELYKKKTDG